ncbi:phosphate ABC transporter ATP-binding protein, partial [Candidatus Roizmanbacteria bacterium RIFCSPLOWO2_02_FULL_38_10]
VKIYGKVEVNKQNIYKKVDLIQLRRKVGMVFQRPNPFPLSIYENCIYGPKVHSLYQKKNHDDIVFKSLEAVNLWDEVKDKLFSNAMLLSAEQKQRLCIARLLAINAEILLMDEPCSTLDPIATQKIEELLMKLKRTVTVVIVTHNMQQASRISDQTGFFLLGEMIEFDDTLTIFTNPKNNKTQDYIEGKFG